MPFSDFQFHRTPMAYKTPKNCIYIANNALKMPKRHLNAKKSHLKCQKRVSNHYNLILYTQKLAFKHPKRCLNFNKCNPGPGVF